MKTVLRKWSMGCVVALALVGWTAVAGEAAGLTEQETAAMKQEVDAKVQTMIDSPVGVFDMEYADGKLNRLKIKGEAEVSTALRGSRADRQARERAERDAKASFSQFMNESVNVVESDAEGFIITEKDGQESAEYNSASMRLVETHSSSFLRGVVVLMDRIEGEGENRKAVVILGWSKKLTDAARDVMTDMARDPETPAPAAAPKAAAAAADAVRSNAGSVTHIGNLDDF